MLSMPTATPPTTPRRPLERNLRILPLLRSSNADKFGCPPVFLRPGYTRASLDKSPLLHNRRRAGRMIPAKHDDQEEPEGSRPVSGRQVCSREIDRTISGGVAWPRAAHQQKPS